jgi:hypothetical protein
LTMCCWRTAPVQIQAPLLQTACYFSFDLRMHSEAGSLQGQTGGCAYHYRVYCVM